MKYEQTIILNNGKETFIRNGDESDGNVVFEIFNRTHEETDYLLSYSDENSIEPEQEAQFLKEKALSPNETELVAIVDGKIVGIAGIEPVGKKYKVKHRAEFGISILKDYWGLGLGKALTKACIQCARAAGYDQLELNVVAGNDRALSLYRSLGFVEFGRNPKGFNSRISGYQEVIYMLLEL
ncbi:MAG: GNAT family N-acetyltransferase [Lachnospiraceae bacterium]|nr:GNAT family N-acetyltransferase [Lachnospiraceae bacterium]